MKQINYSGSSKLISRIVSLLNRKAPLPLDGNGDPSWGTNGQVLTTDGTGATYWSAGGGSGDSVTWTQIQGSGTKIAEIEINGASQDVYAPSGGGGSSYSAGDGINISAQNAISVDTAFTEASTRANISSGDSFSTILGKIKKFFTDLKTVAFSGSYNDLSNKPTIPTDFVSKANGGRFGGSIVIDRQDGTSSAEGVSQLWLGNGAAIGSNGNSHGEIIFYRGQYFNVLVSDSLTNNHYIFLPNNGGTIALTSDITSTLLLNYATPFYMPNAQGTRIRFTFTGLSANESIHLLIFGRFSSADIMLKCGSTGFADVKTANIVDDTTYRMGVTYSPNNGFTLTVQVGSWSAAWGIFIHPHFPNATMTMTREA